MPSSLHLMPTIDIICITETWLTPTPPSRASYPINWKQYHTYGPTTNDNHGTRGISLLINPRVTSPISILPTQQQHPHSLSFTISNYLIHCLYLPPSITDTEALNTLCNLPTSPTSEHTIYCGDFNARVTAFGDHRTTTRGSMLVEWMRSYNLICLNQTMTYGIPTYENITSLTPATSIIDLFITDHFNIPATMEILTSLSLNSPHRAIRLALTITPATPSSTLYPRRTWNLSRLKENDVCALYDTTIANNMIPLHTKIQLLLRHPPSIIPDIDDLCSQFTNNIHQALDSALGTKTPKQKDKNAWFWTPHLQDLVDKREKYYKKLKKHTSILNRQPLIDLYQQAKKQLQLAIKARRRTTWREFLDHLTNQDYQLTTRQIKAMRNKRKPSPSFTSPLGPQAAANTMADTLAAVFDGSLLPNNNSTTQHNINNNTPLDINTHPPPFNLATLHLALRKLPNRKAPGPDHLRAEMLKPVSATILPIISSLFTLCWQWSYAPTLWRQAQIVPIYKKNNPDDPSNYRPISLTSHMRKLMEHCIIDILPANSPPLDISQGGFRHQRSALDQVACLQHIIHHHTKTRSPPVLVCLDIKSAYDTVDRNIIWQQLQPYCSPPLLGLLQNLFNNVTISVLLDGYTSHSFTPITGVLQGSVLSPALYSIYINQLPQILRLADEALQHSLQHLPPPLIRHTTLNSLLYADDIILIGTRDSIPTLLQVAERTSLDLGFRWSPAKCVVLSPPTSAPRIYKLYDTPLPHLPSFRYLGVPISRFGKINIPELIAHNRQAGLAALFSLVPLGLNPHGLPPKLLIALYKQFIRPTMEYGLAITKTTKRHLTPLQQTQQQALRRMFGGHATSETAVIQHLSALPTMSTRSSILQAKFIHRSAYLPPDALLTLLLPRLNSPRSPWSSLIKSNKLHSQLTPNARLNTKIIQSFQHQHMLIQHAKGTYIKACSPSTDIYPGLLLPMESKTRSLIIRWRRGWIPGKPVPCLCLLSPLTKIHTRQCSLIQPITLPEHLLGTNLHPADTLLNLLPSLRTSDTEKSQILPFWEQYWPRLISFLGTVDAFSHESDQSIHNASDNRFLLWLGATPAIPSTY